jgi:hypothetical protein
MDNPVNMGSPLIKNPTCPMTPNGFFMHSAANTSAERAIPIGIPPDNPCSNIYIDNQ